MTASTDPVNGTQQTSTSNNGTSNMPVREATGTTADLSTLPGPNHDWQISLKDKVIASMSCLCRTSYFLILSPMF